MQQEKQALLDKIEGIVQKETAFQSGNEDAAYSLKTSLEQIIQGNKASNGVASTVDN